MFEPTSVLRVPTTHADPKIQAALCRVAEEISAADFVVWSDASAIYVDGLGATASRVYSEKHSVCHTDISLTTATNTNRAELQGLVQGLLRVESYIKKLRVGYPGWTPKVLWVGDRENLIVGITEKSWRKKDTDLWASVEVYESRGWSISACHVPRDCAIPDHDNLDKLASELRVVLKMFMEVNATSFPVAATALDLNP